MAITPKFKVNHGDVFPHGAYVVSEVEPVRDYDKSSAGRAVQASDKESGLPLWAVSVLDADPAARKNVKTVTVKIAASHQPIPPEAAPGFPFRPVEFDGLTATPYVDESGSRARIAFSLRASSMRAPHIGGRPSPKAGQEAA